MGLAVVSSPLLIIRVKVPCVGFGSLISHLKLFLDPLRAAPLDPVGPALLASNPLLRVSNLNGFLALAPVSPDLSNISLLDAGAHPS